MTEPDIINFEQLLCDDENFKKLSLLVKDTKRTIFNIICKEKDELTFSRTLKYFLDPSEDHNLDDRFLKKFLHILLTKHKIENINRLEVDIKDFKNAKVYREYDIGEYGRLDIFIKIEIEDKKQLFIIIENKIYSSEGDEQTKRYKEWVDKYLISNSDVKLLCYLTPDGAFAETVSFLSLSFKDILQIFDEQGMIDELNTENQYLINNFVNWIKELVPMDKKTQKLCMEIYRKYKKEINTIVENIPSPKTFLSKVEEEIRKNCTGKFETNLGKIWLMLSPKEWLKNPDLKETPKYSLPRISYDYTQEGLLKIIFVTKDGLMAKWFENNALKVFGKRDKPIILKAYKPDYVYHYLYEEQFDSENYIDNFNEKAGEYAQRLIAELEYIMSNITDKDIESWIKE
jgi:hypothetical protein